MGAIQRLDYAYARVGKKSLFEHLRAQGEIESLVSRKDVAYALRHPPLTRASSRAALYRKFGERLRHLSWHVAEVEGPRGVRTILLPDPRSEEILTNDEDIAREIAEMRRDLP